ncbi:hypothetical protein ABRP86_10825 [Corynebacterium sp. KPL3927]
MTAPLFPGLTISKRYTTLKDATIVWAGGEEATDAKAQSIGDFLSYYEDLNERAKERIWISKDFPLEKLL